MTRLANIPRRLLACIACALPLAVAAADNPLDFVPYGGSGNVTVFDAMAGTGGWVGRIDQIPPPDVPAPLSLVSVVLFTLDPASHALTGSFEFTTSDLAASLFGSVSGSADADFLTLGGQLSLDYVILGGTGAFDGASGFGIAFLNYDPAGAFDNYSESGLLTGAVPEPAAWALMGAGLLGLGWRRRAAIGAGL